MQFQKQYFYDIFFLDFLNYKNKLLKTCN